MKISIIIPVYNCSKYIEKCIESIHLDKYEDVEVILINDGSKDNTQKICEKICKRFNNITLINKTNEGVSKARNLGIKKSNTEYIMFVDSDDLLNEQWHSIVTNSINENLDCDIIYFSKNIKSNISKNNLYRILLGYDDKKFAGPFSKIYKRKFILRNNINFSEDIINGEDMLFNIEAVNCANKVYCVNKSIYFYREYIGSATKRFNPVIIDSDIRFHQKIETLLKHSSLDDKTQDIIKNYFNVNAILTLFERLSYLDKFSYTKIYIKEIECKYDFYVKKENFSKFSKKKIIIYKMLKHKMYNIVFLIYRIYHKRRVLNTENILEI